MYAQPITNAIAISGPLKTYQPNQWGIRMDNTIKAHENRLKAAAHKAAFQNLSKYFLRRK